MSHLFNVAGGEPVVAEYLNSYGANYTTTNRDAKNWNNGDQIYNTTEGNPQYYTGADGTSIPGSWVDLTGAGAIVGTDVGLTTTSFNKILSGSDTNVQLAMDTIDDHTHAASDITGLVLADVTDVTTTSTELNQALDGISANVTDTNLNTLTAGGASNADSLHTHAGLGGGLELLADVSNPTASTSYTISSLGNKAYLKVIIAIELGSTPRVRLQVDGVSSSYSTVVYYDNGASLTRTSSAAGYWEVVPNTSPGGSGNETIVHAEIAAVPDSSYNCMITGTFGGTEHGQFSGFLPSGIGSNYIDSITILSNQALNYKTRIWVYG